MLGERTLEDDMDKGWTALVVVSDADPKVAVVGTMDPVASLGRDSTSRASSGWFLFPELCKEWDGGVLPRMFCARFYVPCLNISRRLAAAPTS